MEKSHEVAQSAQAGEFQREDRYIVIKRKDLGAVPLEVRESLGVALFQLSKHLPKRECLVIESDWPEYEPTWAAIQARMTGQGAQAGDERAAFLVVGVVDYESTEALAAFLDRSQAESWLAEIEAYQERHPGWWSHDASEQEQDAACEKLESWRKGHPAGVSASSCDSFHVMEIPLRAALATQPADSIAVNRLRLSLVAWDAELAEQDYQLTSDDLREKLRQIHRDIDRLMPEQGQAAVRGAEHE